MRLQKLRRADRLTIINGGLMIGITPEELRRRFPDKAGRRQKKYCRHYVGLVGGGKDEFVLASIKYEGGRSKTKIIAEKTGLNECTVSRCLSGLLKAGKITREGQWVVLEE
jgi:hypothetical protein